MEIVEIAGQRSFDGQLVNEWDSRGIFVSLSRIIE